MSEPRNFTLDEITERTGFDKRTIAYYVQEGLLPKVGRRGPKTRYPQLFLDRLEFVKLIRDKQDQGEVGSLTLAEIRDILDRLPEEMIGDVVAGREPLQVVDYRGPIEAPAATASPRDRAFSMAQRFEDRANGNAAPPPASEVPASTLEASMDPNRRVRLGAMDANSQVKLAMTGSPAMGPNPAVPRSANVATAAPGGPAPSAARAAVSDVNGRPAPDENGSGAPKDDPDKVISERLGWALARLQRSLTNAPKRNRGTTESWHRARITPELTISARNLPDEQAYLLDNLARILKKLLWEAWEE
jgi:DNA-binding transcriptional MerR regulator